MAKLVSYVHVEIGGRDPCPAEKKNYIQSANPVYDKSK